ncbi:transmembrane channel-like protein 7 [Kryptolebias marmoratus]|uniref:Transmembrane channel-like protein n=1 Tax=Kryptolebias marmoratus TaxID=37003 RepID=A0A3Q3BFN8_KRYMA|nr:transmembrane channel-like protein 7 [Kryptolebias marmoratus]
METDQVFFTDYSGRNPLLDQMPSYQASLNRGMTAKWRGTRRGRFSSSDSQKGAESSFRRNEAAEEMELLPIYALVQPMAEKRREKRRRLGKGQDLSRWEYWKGNYVFRQMRENAKVLQNHLQLWKKDIRLIEGMFGTGILSYFYFLRFLVMLNLAIFLLMFAFVMLPMIIVPHTSANVTWSQSGGGNCSSYKIGNPRALPNFHEQITDLLSGEGFMERTYLFYGFYNMDKIHFPHFTYNLSLAYLLTTVAYLLFSLIWIVKRSATGFKRSLVQNEDCFQSFCNKIFAGWDFCITNKTTAKLKKSIMLNELRIDLEEERVRQKIAERSRTERLRIYFIRFVLNVFVIGVLAACFYSIYLATSLSQDAEMNKKKVNFLMDLITEYLPSIVITLANFITPVLFSFIINFEDYSPSFEIRFTLMRCVFMRLTSIGVLLLSLWRKITRCDDAFCECGYNPDLYSCWESRVGQEMYKLTIFDFIIIAAVTIFVEFPRKFLVKYCNCQLIKFWGDQEFSIPQNVLQIVYGQTICWIGTFYCPLLPAICTIKYFLMFYIKKTSLLHNCRPSVRPFRASRSTFFFLVVLLIGLILASLPVVISVAQINSSKACGPFMNYTTSWEVLPIAVSQLPDGVQRFLSFLSSETFAASFFVVTFLAMFYVIALARGYKKVISQLREQLTMEGRDRQFLIQRLVIAQRRSKFNPKPPGRSSRSPRSPSYHTSFAYNHPEAMRLADSPPPSSTQV